MMNWLIFILNELKTLEEIKFIQSIYFYYYYSTLYRDHKYIYNVFPIQERNI